MQKNLDKKNRWRSKTVAFRMSPQEAEQLEIFAKLSGLTKQDYLINRVLQRDLVVNGNPRVYKALRNQLESVLEELQRISSSDDITDELLEVIKLINTTLNGLNHE